MDQIHSESLLHLLTSIVSEAGPALTTGIRVLDDYSATAGLNYHGQVLEVQGPPASGKTHIIYFILVTCILPPSYHSVDLGGWEKVAFVFDTDDAFDVFRLKTVILHRLSSKAIPCELTSDLVDSCLRRLCIIRPTSSLHLATSLANIQKVMSSQFPRHELGVVAVDSLSSFYWPDRFLAERAHGSQNQQTQSDLQYTIGALEALRHSLAPLVVLSNWGLIPTEQVQPVVYRQHLNPFPQPFISSHEGASKTPFSVGLHITTGRTGTGSRTSSLRSMLRNTFLAQRQSLKLFERSPTCATTKTYANQRAGTTVAVRATPNEPTNQRPDFSGHAPVSKHPIRQFMRVLDQWRGRREKKDTQFLLQCTPVLKPYMAGFSKFRLLTDRLIMSENPEYALDALTFAEDLGLHHRHTTYEFYCYHLTVASNWKLVLRTVDLAIQNTGSCSPGLLNRRTRALLELSQYRKLDGMYQEFQAYGHKPDRITFHLLLTGYIRNNSLESARRCLQLMQESGFEVNAATHAIIACAYRNLGLDHSIEEKALENLPEMAQITRVSVLNNILRAHLDDSNIQKALRILSLFDPQSVQVPVDVLFGNAIGGETARSPHHFPMPPVSLSHPPMPNASTFAILIHFCSSKDNFGGTLQLLHCMMSQGIIPSAQVITAMVHACFVGKRPDLAVQLVAGTCDSHATPRSLFDPIYPGSWDGPCFEIHVPNMKPNVQIFNSLLQGVLPLYGLDGAMEVLHIMTVNKVFPNGRTLDLILSHVDVVEKAHPGTLINLLLKVADKIPPTPTHLRIVLRCIIRHEKHLTHSLGWLSWRYWETAKPGYPREDTPQSKDLDFFAGIKFPEFRRWDILSRPLFNALDKQGYKADFEAFSMRIRYEAVIRRDPEAAHQVFNAMVARGLQPNTYHYGALMEGYTLIGNTKAAHHVLDAAKRAGVSANATLYTILMTSYARRRKPRGAMRVFRQMLEDGVSPDVPSIDVVTGSWYAIGAGTMAKRLLVSLWEYIEPFPFNLADKPLTELANHFRGLHNKPGYKTTIISPARRLQLLSKLLELVGDLNTAIEDKVSLDENFVVSKSAKVSEAPLGVHSSRGGALVRKGFRRTHDNCNLNQK